MSVIRDHKAAWAEHRAKQQRKNRAAVSPGVTVSASGDVDIWDAACKQDWDALKAIPRDDDGSHTTRNRQKPKMLDKYRQYLADWIRGNGGKALQNNVLTRNLIWAVDVEQWDYALELCKACVDTQQTMTLIERTPATFFVDSLVQTLEKQSPDYDASLFKLAGEVWEFQNNSWKIEPIALFKLRRVLAKGLKDSDPDTALKHAEAAQAGYSSAGLKTLINELKKVSENT